MSALRLPPSFLIPAWSSKELLRLLSSYRTPLPGILPRRRSASWWTRSYQSDGKIKNGLTTGKDEDTERNKEGHSDGKSTSVVSEVGASKFWT